MAKNKTVLLGGGGHAKGVIEAMKASKQTLPVGILDENASLKGKKVFGIPVLGGDDMLPQLRRKGVTHFAMGLGGVRDNGPREKLFESCIKAGLKPVTVVHPSATVSPSAEIGDGSVLLAKVVVNASAVVGNNVIVNTGAVIEHDCVIGDHAHISTGALLGGSVVVGDLAHVGIGATVRQGITLAERVVVGAGAVVVKDIVSAGLVVAGVPAVHLK